MVAKIPVVLDESTPQLQELTTPDTLNIPADTAITGNISVTGTIDGRDVATDGTKLDTVDTNAADDQTGAEIKTAYESEADTNAYTDSEKTVVGNTSGTNTGDQSQEGTAILSTGETGGSKYLREDGDGTCSWQAVAGGGSGDLLADGTIPLTANWDMGAFNITLGSAEVDAAGSYGTGSGLQFGGAGADVNSELYRVSQQVLRFRINGADRWYMDNNYFGGPSAGYASIKYGFSSATAPMYSFVGDTDTGIGTAALDQLSLIAGGVEGARIEEGNNGTVGAHIFIPNLTTAPTGNPTGGGYMYVESGALKYRGSSGTVTTLGPA